MKGKKQPNMVLSPERAQMLLRLTDEDAGKVTKALVAYANTRALPEGFSEVLLFCFHTLLDELEQNWEKKRSRSEQNRRSARIRWMDANACECMHTDANACERMQTDANACERMQTDANACERITEGAMHKNPLDYLLTGEDGEPIVIYRSC